MGVRGLFHCVFSYLSGVLSSLLLSPLTIPTQMFTGGRAVGAAGLGSMAWCGAAGDKGAALWGGVRCLCLRLWPAGPWCATALAVQRWLWWALPMAKLPSLRAPFPWFGGKARVAEHVWQRLGAVGPDACQHYIEPFLGSAAVLLARPGGAGKVETVNDANGYLVNLWRALRAAPAELAEAVVGPVAEVDLHARHLVLLERGERLVTLLLSDPYAYDLELAAWWLSGQAAWLGGGWCAGDKGCWGRLEDGTFGKVAEGHAGPRVTRRLPYLAGPGNGVHALGADVPAWFAQLAQRLQHVRIAQGDWTRVLGASIVRERFWPVAIFLDPPYEGYEDVYSERTGGSASAAVREWALAHGDNPNFRIALCGYEGEHKMPDSWAVWEWKAAGGYGVQSDKQGRENAARERIWFSPHCLVPGGNGRGAVEWW